MLNNGLNYFAQGYIHYTKIYTGENNLEICARWWCSIRESDTKYTLLAIK